MNRNLMKLFDCKIFALSNFDISETVIKKVYEKRDLQNILSQGWKNPFQPDSSSFRGDGTDAVQTTYKSALENLRGFSWEERIISGTQ